MARIVAARLSRSGPPSTREGWEQRVLELVADHVERRLCEGG